MFPSENIVFVDIEFSIVAAGGRCWVAVPAIESARRVMEFVSGFHFLVFAQPLVNCCHVILVLIGSDVGVMVGCVVLKCLH